MSEEAVRQSVLVEAFEHCVVSPADIDRALGEENRLVEVVYLQGQIEIEKLRNIERGTLGMQS